MKKYTICCFCNKTLVGVPTNEYCSNCLDVYGGFRFYYFGNFLYLSNKNGNLFIVINDKGWFLDSFIDEEFVKIQSGDKIITPEEGVAIMNRYEKIKAFI